MNVTLNGESKVVRPGSTVAMLLVELGLAGRPCAVEVNRRLVSKSQHAAHELKDGDAVEIVTLVGGG